MKQKTRKHPSRTRAHTKKNGECIIPGAIPVDVLEDFVLKTGGDEADNIRSYMEWQAPDEKVKHLEKVASENVYGAPMDAWDVRTNKGRWWVITNPTNLYSQRLFPSLDYTLSFHVGVTTRMSQSSMCEEEEQSHDRINELTNRLARARSTLFEAKKIEDFQSVGMKCRECLILLAQSLALPEMVPAGTQAPQRANFIDWSDFIANHLALGSSNERIRSYLKVISKSTWELVNWLTHAHSADKFAGALATDATENVLMSFILARARYDHKKERQPHNRRKSKQK